VKDVFDPSLPIFHWRRSIAKQETKGRVLYNPKSIEVDRKIAVRGPRYPPISKTQSSKGRSVDTRITGRDNAMTRKSRRSNDRFVLNRQGREGEQKGDIDRRHVVKKCRHPMGYQRHWQSTLWRGEEAEKRLQMVSLVSICWLDKFGPRPQSVRCPGRVGESSVKLVGNGHVSS